MIISYILPIINIFSDCQYKSSEYTDIVNSWKAKCENINSTTSANTAGSDLCNSYLCPADSTQAQKRASRAELIYSEMMTSIE